MGMHDRNAAERFDATAREVFAPLYPVMARRILDESAKTDGRCLDIGCGSGWLGIALAQASDLHVTFCDVSEVMLELAGGHLEASGLAERGRCVAGNVHALPFPEASFDLVVSRGSFPFWGEPEKAAAEIFRVLRPGGVACIGGGFGNREIHEEVVRKMRERDPQWQERVKRGSVPRAVPRLIEGVLALEAEAVTITRDERGLMIRFGR